MLNSDNKTGDVLTLPTIQSSDLMVLSEVQFRSIIDSERELLSTEFTQLLDPRLALPLYKGNYLF